jgi:hypothetical protein
MHVDEVEFVSGGGVGRCWAERNVKVPLVEFENAVLDTNGVPLYLINQDFEFVAPHISVAGQDSLS